MLLSYSMAFFGCWNQVVLYIIINWLLMKTDEEFSDAKKKEKQHVYDSWGSSLCTKKEHSL